MDQSMDQSMGGNKTLTIVGTIIITALVVGGGVYTWLNFFNKDSGVKFNCEQSGGTYETETCVCGAGLTYEAATGYCITEMGAPGGELLEQAQKLLELKMIQSDIMPLLSVPEYGFKFVTSAKCAPHFEVKKVESNYEVHLTNPEAFEWGPFPLITYSVMTQAAYDLIPEDELPGKPKIFLELDDGLLVTAHSPQDGPPSWPENNECAGAVELEKM